MVSAIEIWYKHLDKVTLQVIYQQDLSLMILRVSIKSYLYPRLFFHFEWVVCWLNRRRSCFPLSLTGEISINLHNIYIYIIALCQILIFVVFFWGGTRPFFLNWWSYPGVGRVRLAPAKVMILVQTSPRGQVRVTPRAGWFGMDDPTKMILNDLKWSKMI